MIMMRTPGTTPAGRGAEPERRRGGVRIAGFSIRFTGGAYILAILAVVVSALSLGAAAPGWPASAYAAATAGVVVALLASMTGHELAHAAAARRHGACCGEIWVGFFGGTVHGRYLLPTPRAQWRAAAAGPAVSLAAAAISVAAAAGLSALGARRLAVLVFAAAALINVVLGVASLLPGAGLDGGRIIGALAWARTGDPVRGGLAAARTGQATGAAFAAAGLVALALGYIAGIALGLIGLLMISASRAEARQVLLTAALAGLRVRDIVPLSPVAAAHSWQTVRAFLDGEVRAGPAGSAAAAFPLRNVDGALAGILTLSQPAALPAGRRDTARLPEVATPIAHIVTTTPDEPPAPP